MNYNNNSSYTVIRHNTVYFHIYIDSRVNLDIYIVYTL